MTQSQRGSAHAGVSDLRNIVDRLDLLMGASAGAAAEATSQRSQLDEAVADLLDRVGVLEGEVEDLRTLVNHLMTIATWQAKVTATLVGDDAEDEAPDDPGRHNPPAAEQRHGVIRQTHAPPVDDDGARRPHHGQQTTTLDDDIDEILGTDRESSGDDTAPPDFGI